jgi:2-polyprenyl-6-methoxyphenol hydroxylase-like FAD-dependent oxidoreductase
MPRIGIVGAGIGGLQLALFLQKHGIAATVYAEPRAFVGQESLGVLRGRCSGELNLFARLGDANGFQRTTDWRHRQTGSRHQLAKKKPGLRVRDRRLHANPDETVGIVHRLPGVNGELAAPVVGISVIPDVQLGPMVREDLHDFGPSFVCGAV